MGSSSSPFYFRPLPYYFLLSLSRGGVSGSHGGGPKGSESDEDLFESGINTQSLALIALYFRWLNISFITCSMKVLLLLGLLLRLLLLGEGNREVVVAAWIRCGCCRKCRNNDGRRKSVIRSSETG
ncbi:unnamed protein product [Lathyrus sativus]|nr:unnamed protein product [Lathyrus sativus]